MPEWRNWQTHTTQNRAGNHVGSSPTLGTIDKKAQKICVFLFSIFNSGTRKGTCQASSWSGASRSEGKNSPVDYFCDAGASCPTLGTKIKWAVKSIIFIIFAFYSYCSLITFFNTTSSNAQKYNLNSNNCFHHTIYIFTF